MKSIILASAFAAALVFGLPPAAEAKTSVKIFLGFPHYSYQVGPDYVFRDGYGWYSPRYRKQARLSCGEAKRTVNRHGYRNVTTVECQGATYTFKASRNGNRVKVYLNSRSGAVWRG
jgi:hypothetical protein